MRTRAQVRGDVYKAVKDVFGKIDKELHDKLHSLIIEYGKIAEDSVEKIWDSNQPRKHTYVCASCGNEKLGQGASFKKNMNYKARKYPAIPIATRTLHSVTKEDEAFLN